MTLFYVCVCIYMYMYMWLECLHHPYIHVHVYMYMYVYIILFSPLVHTLYINEFRCHMICKRCAHTCTYTYVRVHVHVQCMHGTVTLNNVTWGTHSFVLHGVFLQCTNQYGDSMTHYCNIILYVYMYMYMYVCLSRNAHAYVLHG